MKNVLLLTKRQFQKTALAIAGVAAFAPAAWAQGEKGSPRDCYEKGRVAFYQKRYDVAKPYFIKVLKAVPNYGPAKAMLATILEAEKKAGAENTMLGWCKRLKLPKIEVEEATLEEVITFVRVKSRELTKGAWEPNFIVRLAKGEEMPRVTISLRNVPVTYVVQKMAELSGLGVRYDEHAITVAPKDLLPPEPDPSEIAEKKAKGREKDSK